MHTAPPDLARSALDAAPDAMIIIDAAGLIRFTNRQVAALFGYRHDEIIGEPIEVLLPERFRARHIAIVSAIRAACASDHGVGLELFGRRRNGTEFPVEISLSPIAEAEHGLVAAAIRDVTDRKRVEAELIVAREAAEAARELADQARELATGQIKEEPVSRHRQPRFATAAANARNAQRRPAPPHHRPAFHRGPDAAGQAIGAMSRLLNALLDISKLESGAIRPEPTDFAVAAIFEELRLEFASIAANKGLTLEIERCNEAAYSDPSLVEQILRNLVSNAVKYTPRGFVRLRCLHEAGLVRVEVVDTGIGIPQDQLAYIYEEFYQVGVPTNVSRDGYGLGLSIVQRLVKLLTLKLDVHSESARARRSRWSCRRAAAGRARIPRHRRRASNPLIRLAKRAFCWSRTTRPCGVRRPCCSSWRAIASRPSPR